MSESTHDSVLSRHFAWWLVAITALALVLRLAGLWDQPATGDDRNTVITAWSYVQTGQLGPTMWNHPPLRNLLVYVSTAAFGTGAWGIRLPSLILGTLSVPLLALFTRATLRSAPAALLAALFLALDALHVDFSRQAVQEVYMACFTLMALLALLRHDEDRRVGWIALAGLAFGLGLASKWYVAGPWVLTTAWVVWRAKTAHQESWLASVALAVPLVALPLAIYVLSYLPWFGWGYTLAEWGDLQLLMLQETTGHGGPSTYHATELDHRPLLWFIKPLVGYADFRLTAEGPFALIAIAQPLTWLLVLPGVGLLTHDAIQERDPRHILLAALFWVTWLPLALAQRPVWLHTAFAVLPFGLAAVGALLWRIASSTQARQRALIAYLVVVILTSIPLWVLATGGGLEYAWLQPVAESFRPADHVGDTTTP